MVIEKLYKDNEKLIYKAIHLSIQRSKAKNIDIDEVKSEANIIFMNILSKFDETKNTKLSSYLFKSVYYGIFDYCLNKGSYRKSNAYKSNENSIDPFIFDFVIFNKVFEKINYEMLSTDAQHILNYILSRDWEDTTKEKNKKPSKHSISKKYNLKYGWTYSRIEKAWNEISIWWNKEGYTYG